MRIRASRIIVIERLPRKLPSSMYYMIDVYSQMFKITVFFVRKRNVMTVTIRRKTLWISNNVIFHSFDFFSGNFYFSDLSNGLRYRPIIKVFLFFHRIEPLVKF